MNILVKGGTGFIEAKFLSDCLASSDESVIKLDELTYAAYLKY